MTWQHFATAIVVLGALAYIVFKMGFASWPGRLRRRPDVPLSRLRKKRRIGPDCCGK